MNVVQLFLFYQIFLLVVFIFFETKVSLSAYLLGGLGRGKGLVISYARLGWKMSFFYIHGFGMGR